MVKKHKAQPKVNKTTAEQRIKSWTIHHKLAAIATVSFGLVAVLVVLPQLRYDIASIFIKKDVSFLLTETNTGTTIEDADVIFDGKQYRSDATGMVVIKHVSVGKKSLIISKPFYEPLQTIVVVGPIGQTKQQTFKMLANGELVRLTVKNRISGRPIQGALVRVGNSGQVHTNGQGVANLVLPLGSKSAAAKVSGDTILDTSITLFNANDSTTNVALAIPKGRIFALRKNNRVIDVVSTNLDGSDAKIVVAGTGKEYSGDTQLIMSAGGEFVALKSRRDDELNAKLYVYDSKKDIFSAVDQEPASVIPVGWSGTKFIYMVHRKDVQLWKNAKQSLKSYDAVSKTTNTIDETRGEGTSNIDFANESIESVYILAGKVVYTKKWQASYYYGARLSDKRMVVVSANPDGSRLSVVRDWQAGYNAYIKSAQSSPLKLNIYVELDGVKINYYTYQNEQVAEQSTADSVIFTDKNQYPTFYTNPNGLSTIWATKQNGKNTVVYLGNKNGDGAREVASTAEYDVVGWYNDEYVLLSSNLKSQLFVMSKQGLGSGIVPIIVGEYLKPLQDYRAFGYGK